MAEKTRVGGPTRVGKGAYNPTQQMTPEQAKTLEEGGKATRAEQLKKRAARVYGERKEAPMQQQARPKADVSLRQVTPKKTPKKYIQPESAFTGKGPGQTTREAGGKDKYGRRKPVDLATGKTKPTKTYGERMIGAMERFGAKVAPPGSVTRLREKPEGPPSTLQTRMESIGRVSAKSFPGRKKASRPGGILNIPELAGRTKGPSLESQKATAADAYRRKRFREKTAADVPQATAKVTPTGKGVEVLKGPGELGEGHLGSYRIKGTAAPIVTAKKVTPPTKTTTRRAPVTPKKELSLWEKAKAALSRGVVKMGELSAEATKDAAQYEERKAGKKKDVTKVKAALARGVPKPERKKGR